MAFSTTGNRGPLAEIMTDTMRETAGNQPELRIAANQDAEYAVLAEVLAAAKNAQVQRIAFVQ
ncbi:hypothetical protein LL965_06000 [Xanthomonas cassavae CFBP 4642]|uniref:Biopolymer transporter ExbD n=1 Tax=Xanthomonas cassavae CFBP 4642 TaxID=1219375 RepID=A0ABS8HCY0_9XANT|nr:hypothetical protein [Xanthomonas cassavae]MCC4619659.1 hypothetical protein [Xanthomonas cassavae CFBP 4642]